jgi:integrase/recombinase XerD
MMQYNELVSARASALVPRADRLRLAVAAYLARVQGHFPRPRQLRSALLTSVDVRDVQVAARHADPRTTMRYDRARKNLDRHPNYIPAAYMASGT